MTLNYKRKPPHLKKKQIIIESPDTYIFTTGGVVIQ